MFSPNTLMESLGLAKLEEDNIVTQQRSKSTFVPFRNMVTQRPPIMPAPRTTPIKHLFEAEMQECREERICYNCDEKFTRGHRCVEKKLYLLDVDSLPTPEICEDAQDPVDGKVENQQLPINPPY